MKKDKLEQFISDNADDFNSLEPPVMAWDAIQNELPGAKKPVIRNIWPYAWKVAAAVLIFTSAWLLNDYMDQKKTPERHFAKTETSPNPELNDLSDAEAYYATKISNKQAELAVYAKQHPEIIEDLKQEFREMDKNKAELKKDLAESNADEKVIEAIIQSYRVKLEILDQMLSQLRSSNEAGNTQKRVETKM
jgi:hypothetical protein